MGAELKSTAMTKEKKNEIRSRLRDALSKMGIDDKEASLRSGFGATFVHDFLHGAGSKFENLERLALSNGIRWEWLKDGAPPSLLSEQIALPLDRELVLLAVEGILAYYRPGAPLARLRAAAAILLASAECPPGDTSETDTRNRIHSEIRGVLRQFSSQSNQLDTW